MAAAAQPNFAVFTIIFVVFLIGPLMFAIGFYLGRKHERAKQSQGFPVLPLPNGERPKV